MASHSFRYALIAGLMVASVGSFAEAFSPNRGAIRRARNYNWHANHAHVQYGQPVALVVPPTVNLQTQWGWGVSSSRVTRLDHQFGRNWPGPGPFGGPYRPQPVWPQDTAQFGVYHVRGPW